MTRPLELCCDCERPTGKAGQSEDSIYITLNGQDLGPYCEECREKIGWICATCEQWVDDAHVTVDETHDSLAGGCGGHVS